MFGIRFNIKNPCRVKKFVGYYVAGGHLLGNKFWELQLSYYNNDLFSLEVDATWWGHDHAGPRFEINILGYVLAVQVADTRHWDNLNNCWSK